MGRQFDVKNVADGFALNLLFPRKLAELATKEKVAALESRRAEIAHLIEADAKALHVAFQKLDGTAVTVRAGKANDQGSLYQGLTSEDVAAALSKAVGAKVPTDAFELTAPIKTSGEHKLVLKVGENTASVSIIVEAT